ncbi:odorant receptor 13a-like isoform X3 [Vespula squamosa]|uniref:Odorant receptor 13a-like isoform X3 n=1 Tax=Vespula squamosa TaxID=30214 RepID=A0ABD1ZTB1_VESSQ
MSLQKITYPPRICFRLADTSEDSFNIVTCLHMSLARSEKVYIFTFLIYFCLLLCTLYSYCYVGQCLIEEVLIEFLLNCNSMCNFTPSFYWYDFVSFLFWVSFFNSEHELVRCDLSLRLVRVVDDQFKISLHFHDSEDIDGVLISSTNIYANKRENDIEEQLKSKRFRRDKLKSRELMICKNCTTCIRNKSRGQEKNCLRSRLSSAERPYEIVSILEDLEELDRQRSTRIY